MAVAIARGTPAKPLCEPEDLYQAKIVEASEPAQARHRARHDGLGGARQAFGGEMISPETIAAAPRLPG